MTNERIIYGLLGDNSIMSLSELMYLMNQKREPIEQAISTLIADKKIKRIGKTWKFQKA